MVTLLIRYIKNDKIHLKPLFANKKKNNKIGFKLNFRLTLVSDLKLNCLAMILYHNTEMKKVDTIAFFILFGVKKVRRIVESNLIP